MVLTGEKDYHHKSLMRAKSGPIVKGDARMILKIEIAGERYLVVMINNEAMQIFEY